MESKISTLFCFTKVKHQPINKKLASVKETLSGLLKSHSKWRWLGLILGVSNNN